MARSVAEFAESSATASKVLLGVTGSVAAIRTPELYAALKEAGHEVRVVATDAALYFFDPARLDPARLDPARLDPADPQQPARNPQVVIVDADEWPGRGQGRLYQRSDQVLHIELRRWADLLLIAPLDANTLAKLAVGLADNCLTCVWRAWDRNRPVLLAPAMNTLMWEHPLTSHHLRQIAAQFAAEPAPTTLELLPLIDWVNGRCPKLKIIAPVSKRLACDDIGMGAMAPVAELVQAVKRES